MRRRAFLAGVGGALAWPLTGRAQSNGSAKRVGVILGLPEANPVFRQFVAEFSAELARLAAAEPRGDVRIEAYWSGPDAERARATVKSVIETGPDAILGVTTPVARALKEAATSIPIVFALVGDPVGSNIVESLARPGGNITGFAHTFPQESGKSLSLLKEAAPAITRVALLFNPATAPGHGAFFLDAFLTTAQALGVEPAPTPVRSPEDCRAAVEALTPHRDGLVLENDAFVSSNSQIIVDAAARVGAPCISPFGKSFAASGGLLSYAADANDQFRRSAAYVDRILRGEKPGDLPVQTPTRWQLFVNLKTAAALGLEMPPALLAAADEVIE